MMGGSERRRILRLDGSERFILTESRFESEKKLQDAIAAHPEVLPHEEFRLGTLMSLAVELDLGAGPMDLLCTDRSGRLAIVEFKKGSENPDVRRVIAQLLDYGSALWRADITMLEAACKEAEPGFAGSLEEYACDRCALLGEELDATAFRGGMERVLASGNFVFLYVARDFDDRTKRVMTYLAEGPRMSFFAVEVDHFIAGTADGAVLVPRSVLVPSWVAAPSPAVAPDLNNPAFTRLVDLMDQLAIRYSLIVRPGRTGKLYKAAPDNAWGVGVYASGRGFEVDLVGLRQDGGVALADAIQSTLSEISGRAQPARFPSTACQHILDNWDRTRREVLQPYFECRAAAPKGPAAAGAPSS
jgi:hypothetical protein